MDAVVLTQEAKLHGLEQALNYYNSFPFSTNALGMCTVINPLLRSWFVTLNPNRCIYLEHFMNHDKWIGEDFWFNTFCGLGVRVKFLKECIELVKQGKI